jgi:hypothetical protein
MNRNLGLEVRNRHPYRSLAASVLFKAVDDGADECASLWFKATEGIPHNILDYAKEDEKEQIEFAEDLGEGWVLPDKLPVPKSTIHQWRRNDRITSKLATVEGHDRIVVKKDERLDDALEGYRQYHARRE